MYLDPLPNDKDVGACVLHVGVLNVSDLDHAPHDVDLYHYELSPDGSVQLTYAYLHLFLILFVKEIPEVLVAVYDPQSKARVKYSAELLLLPLRVLPPQILRRRLLLLDLKPRPLQSEVVGFVHVQIFSWEVLLDCPLLHSSE